jgi:hypothetical protein
VRKATAKYIRPMCDTVPNGQAARNMVSNF